MINLCVNCGQDVDKVGLRRVIASDSKLTYVCMKCSDPYLKVDDVWYGYDSGIQSEENIADPKTGEPIPFWDKASKKAAMRKAGVIECGDKYHGARNEYGKRKTYFT